MDTKAKRAELSGEIFLRSRFDAGISQDHMALALGITRQTIRNWERGISSPTIFRPVNGSGSSV